MIRRVADVEEPIVETAPPEPEGRWVRWVYFTVPGYAGPAGPVAGRPVISSVRVEKGPGHDHVHVWNRGGKAGTLVVGKGDGEAVARLLIGPDATREEA